MPFVGAIPVPGPSGSPAPGPRRAERRRLNQHEAEASGEVIRELDEAQITAPERSDQDGAPRDPRDNSQEEAHEDREHQGVYGPGGKRGSGDQAPKLDIKG